MARNDGKCGEYPKSPGRPQQLYAVLSDEGRQMDEGGKPYPGKEGRRSHQGIRLHTQRGEGPPGGEREDRRGQARHPGSDHFFREETQGGKRETL